MGDFVGTVKVDHGKGAKKVKKAARGPKSKRVWIAGEIHNDPKKTQRLVADLKKLAKKYTFKVKTT